MTRRVLLPLVPIYAAAAAAKNALFDYSWAETRQLRWPVISVGNISVGGSGKTPLVICLARLLQQRGLHVDVLSRGYGRSSDAVERLDPAGNAEQFGDEPLLIARSADVPVYVGASRYAAGALAESGQAATGIHILDDGFQHRKLDRIVDIVLIHRSDFAEMLLPAGLLREPLNSLRRASILVLREEDRDLEIKLKERGIERPIWWIKRSIIVPNNLGKTLVFCGIARSEELFQMLEQRGFEMIGKRVFGDHHPYSDDDVQQLIQEAQVHSANSFLTTQKDLVRLSSTHKEMLASAATLQVAKLEVRLRDETAILDELQKLLSSDFKRLL